MKSAAAMVSAKDLQKAVADLQETRPGPGLVKTLICALATVPCVWVALTADSVAVVVVAALLAGLAYSAWIITTHDAIHHTLTGIGWLDEALSRAISWPIIWFHCSYAEIHKIHHKMNGDDIADPERVQWTQAEYAAASPLGRFYVRHQWFFDLFVFGGFGMIYKTVAAAIRFAPRSASLRRALVTDFAGILAANAVIYTVAIQHGRGLQTFAVWLCLERCTGGVIQWRAHIEHYGLWGKGRHYFETQAYNCRNLTAAGWVSWFFNRLNFHSVHHAFPRVPFYHLETAHRRFQALYGEHIPEPLVQDSGYFATSLRLARRPVVIGPVDPASPSQRRQMLAVSP